MAEEKPSTTLMRLVNGYQVSQAIHAAAVLGIADLLKDGPRNNDELAKASETHAQALYRLLRTLAALGVLRELHGKRFELTQVGDGLRSDSVEPAGPWARFVGGELHRKGWGEILYSVRTGESGFVHAVGTDPWTARAKDPAANTAFNEAMVANGRRVASSVLAAYDWAQFATVCDVGGGRGALLAAILKANPAVRGILFDQPHVVSEAAPLLEAACVADRCQTVGGSFFERVPAGADAIVMMQIIHDWPDDKAVAILRNCRAALSGGGKLLIVEREVAGPNEGPEAKLSDLNMLVMLAAQERTRDEYAALLKATAFRLVRVVPTDSWMLIYEAVPV